MSVLMLQYILNMHADEQKEAVGLLYYCNDEMCDFSHCSHFHIWMISKEPFVLV